MSNYTNHIKGKFTIVSNHVVNNTNLSWKAKGIFAYLASKPTGWNFYMKEIQKNSTDGRTSLQSGIKELETEGYLKRSREFDENNQIVGWNWELTIPEISHLTENPPNGKPFQRKTPSCSNTEYSNTKSSKTEDLLKEDLEDNTSISQDTENDFSEFKKQLEDAQKGLKEHYGEEYYNKVMNGK